MGRRGSYGMPFYLCRPASCGAYDRGCSRLAHSGWLPLGLARGCLPLGQRRHQRAEEQRITQFRLMPPAYAPGIADSSPPSPTATTANVPPAVDRARVALIEEARKSSHPPREK
jgi:hypothetical protein